MAVMSATIPCRALQNASNALTIAPTPNFTCAGLTRTLQLVLQQLRRVRRQNLEERLHVGRHIGRRREEAVNQHGDAERRKDSQQRVEGNAGSDERRVVLPDFLPHAQQNVAPTGRWNLPRMVSVPATTRLQAPTARLGSLLGNL